MVLAIMFIILYVCMSPHAERYANISPIIIIIEIIIKIISICDHKYMSINTYCHKHNYYDILL